MDTNANVRTVQKCYECFGRGDIAGILAVLADDVVWEEPSHPDIPYGGKRKGKAAVREFFAAVGQVAVSRFEAREYIASGDRVVALGTWAGTVSATGKSFQSDWAMAWTISDGRVTRFAGYEDTAAVAAAFRR